METDSDCKDESKGKSRSEERIMMSKLGKTKQVKGQSGLDERK